METQDRAHRPITTRRAHVPTKSPAVGPSSRPDVASQRSVTVRKICQDPLRCLNGPGLHSHLAQVPREPQQAASASSSTTKQGGPILKRTRPELLHAEVSVEKRVRARNEQQKQQLRDMPQSESVAMPAEPPAEAVCAPSRPGHDGRSGEKKPPKDEGAVKKTEDTSMKTLADWVSELKRDREQRAADARAERAPAAGEKKKPEPRLNMLTGREDTAKIPVDGNIQRVAQLAPAYISPNLLSGATLGGYPYGHAYNYCHPVNGIAAGSSTVFSQPLNTASVRAPWTSVPVLCAVPLCMQQAVSGSLPSPADVSAGGRDDPICALHYELRAESELRMQELRKSGLERKCEEEKEKQPEPPRQPEKADACTLNIQEEYRELLDKLVRWRISTEGVQAIKDELGRLTIVPTSATAPEAETGKGPSELDAVDTEIRPGANEAGKARKAGEADRGPKTSSTDPDGSPSEYTQRWVTDPVRATGGKDVSGNERHPYSGCDSSVGVKPTAPAPGKAVMPPVEPTTLSTMLADAAEAPPSDRRPGGRGAGAVASLALPASGGDEHRSWVHQSDVRKRFEERKRNKARKRDEAKAKEEARMEAQNLVFDVVDASEGDNPGDEYVEVAACESGHEDDGAAMCNVSRKEIPEMAKTSTAATEAAITEGDFVLL
ncbi:hypothetical protein CDEST_11698 [Colletotrichum destructivum]|uniref:BZIP domain-containing protein n=1 Tax=Colletotrichum destructivum TaxID=34406 RepID=A0AAX4ITV8_9PEZI|nr:hypothetical protein CDEST_11698 [Colletotrichum destructivum]